jgi:amino acid transporter
MVAIGEMATYMPVSGAFTIYASRFVDRSLGFSMGWIYWFNWAITFALELTASGLIIQYWEPNVNIGILIGVFFTVITALNLFPVSVYGEIEFWFASVKVVTITGFLIFGICINAGAGQHGYLGFDTWNNPGAFAPFMTDTSKTLANNIPLAKFVGLWAVMVQAGFSYQGTELVGIAAGETADPRTNVPKAIRQTFWRILFFFVLTIFFIGILIPYDNKQLLNGSTDAASSPLVIAANLAGVSVLPNIINGVIFTVVLSAANSNVFSGSRILVGLADQGFAPQIFKKTSKKGVPYYAVAFTAMFGLLGFLNESSDGGVVFNWFMNISGVAGFITWACIGLSHIGFMRALDAKGISRDSLPYKAMLQPYFTWYGISFNILIILTQGFQTFAPWSTSDFFAAYISLLLFVVLYVGHKVITRCPFANPIDVDLSTGTEEPQPAELRTADAKHMG